MQNVDCLDQHSCLAVASMTAGAGKDQIERNRATMAGLDRSIAGVLAPSMPSHRLCILLPSSLAPGHRCRPLPPGPSFMIDVETLEHSLCKPNMECRGC